MNTVGSPVCLLHVLISDDGGHYLHSQTTLSFTQPTSSGEGGHYVHIQSTLASCTDHLVAKEANISTVGNPVCLLHVPIIDEGGHYLHCLATLSFAQATLSFAQAT